MSPFFRFCQRFKGVKVADTGLDPMGSFVEFTKKDLIRNIDVHRDAFKPMFVDRPTISATKKPMVPAMAGVSLERSGVRLKTDHISFDPPVDEQKYQKVVDKIMTAPPYSGNCESLQGWKEMGGCKTINNRSSVGYDIITNDENKYSKAEIVRTLDKKVMNRKKGIAEFYDITRVTAEKTNEGHRTALEANPRAFYRKLGIFTHTYDAAVRNGNPSGPFKAQK